ncbi:histidyl-tRNA synthetase [Legionella beliardensis]|uniref:Histidine--tRNA ligase n=1 Tax=Legionella beliardensis TaxID=91822 RepID=A0A378I1R7_9GAMM|nr:histidyl-tRNA synthetase [Legionella beliardensis]
MVDKIRAVRGMNDVLPHETESWRLLEQTFIRCLTNYAYQEIRFPLIESTQLFKRTIGEVTDIVEKEMYTFQDLNGDSITLRPEGTAGCLRACLEHGLLYNQQQKLWYIGPMFRHERPQKGRYRQFNQLGVEALGIAGTAIELELIAICKRLWQELGVNEVVHLQINTLGELNERQNYKEQLVLFFNKHHDKLDEDSQRRLTRNPLRILDSKNPDMQALLVDAPKLIDYVGEESKQHFFNLCAGLDKMGIAYEVNPFLVRGLDYYGHTVFEWVTDKLGSQATVCAGGRYDSLIQQLGGNPMPAVGFAMGAERLLLLMDTLAVNLIPKANLSLFLIATNEEGMQQALIVAEQLRDHNQNWQVITNTAGGSFKSQFKKADKIGAHLALIFGEEELKNGQISIKDLRNTAQQVTISQKQLISYLQDYKV